MKDALGLLETKGLTAAVNGADAAVKAADVAVTGIEKIGSAYVTVVLRGDVASVNAAISAAAEAAAKYGKVVSSCVIPRPHIEVLKGFGLMPSQKYNNQ
jgi:Carbon dioxide concentrating mechanism/carboxysome shell protein